MVRIYPVKGGKGDPLIRGDTQKAVSLAWMITEKLLFMQILKR